MYDKVRLLMTILVMVLTALILRSITFKLARKTKLSKWYKLFNIAVYIIVFFGFSAAISWPIENLFVSFDSPEAAYRYLKDDAIIQVVDGKDTTFVAAQNSQIIPKVYETKDNVVRWKLPAQNATTGQYKDVEHNFFVFLYHYKDTSEYYLSILSIRTMTTEPIQVSDSLASEFVFSERRIPLTDQKYVECFAYIPDPPKNYWVKINDQTVDLSDWLS